LAQQNSRGFRRMIGFRYFILSLEAQTAILFDMRPREELRAVHQEEMGQREGEPLIQQDLETPRHQDSLDVKLPT
jgi:hypothetical protein